MTHLLLPLLALSSLSGPQLNQGPIRPNEATLKGSGNLICPLKRTEVNGFISGSAAEVSVVQVFTNPSTKPIEAVYTFPLPAEAAVNRLRIKTGDVVTEGEVQRRDEARATYERARNAGQVAALLDQERDNVFTQSVANILPGAEVQVEIRYVQAVRFESGQFEFHFPMVVGPRNLSQAKDPSKIDPPRTRSGSGISIRLQLDAGVPIQKIVTPLHEVTLQRPSPTTASIQLKRSDEIPNRDFIVRYQVAADAVKSSILSNFDAKLGGTVSVEVLPPAQPKESQIMPREVFLVMDQSGSQNGFPIEKSKDLTRQMLTKLRASDRFNVFGFNTAVQSLFSVSQPPTKENLDRAIAFVNSMQANGGTNILEGIRAALAKQDPERLRLIVLNTDGYVGNDGEIIAEIRKSVDKARIFTFGIGNSVNRFLIDAMSQHGRGASETVTLQDGADSAIERFLARTSSPVLRDVQVRIEGVDAESPVPAEIKDVFAGQPIVVSARYARPGLARAVVTGTFSNGKPYREEFTVNLASRPVNPALTTRWAREKVRDLSVQMGDFPGTANTMKRGESPEEEIVKLGLRYQIVTQYTSFVAVDKRVVNVGGKQLTVAVPVPQASGVSMGEPTGSPGLGGLRFGAASGGGGMGGFGGGMISNSTVKSSLAPSVAGSQGRIQFVSADASPVQTVDPKGKIEPKLLSLKGMIQVQVLCQRLADIDKEALKKVGLEIQWSDDKRAVLIGRIDAKKLLELAKLGNVAKIGTI